MGLFSVRVKLASFTAPDRAEEVSLLVETGATLSWIPRKVLERLGVHAVSQLPFTLADGQELERETSAVLLTVDGRKAAVPVAFGEPGEEAVLGATALEILGLVVDPVAENLVPRNLLALRTILRSGHVRLRNSLVIEATKDPNFFGFYSPELEGFTGVGRSVEDCLYKARGGMEEHVALLREQGLPVPPPTDNPRVIIENVKPALSPVQHELSV